MYLVKFLEHLRQNTNGTLYAKDIMPNIMYSHFLFTNNNDRVDCILRKGSDKYPIIININIKPKNSRITYGSVFETTESIDILNFENYKHV